jgi:penicillin-binding protein 1C
VRPHPRTLWGKVTEAAMALRIEAHLSKERILTEYLNRVSYGPNLRGFGAASQAYFAEPPAALSVAQTALIAGLPRGPSIYDVTHHPDRARERRDRVLTRMRDDGMIDDAALARARDEPLVTAAAHLVRPAFGAPHFVRALLQGSLAREQPALAEALATAKAEPGALGEIETTLDPELQRAAEAAVGRAVHALDDSHVTAGAAVVVDNATGDILAYVGSPDFFDEEALSSRVAITCVSRPTSHCTIVGSVGSTATRRIPRSAARASCVATSSRVSWRRSQPASSRRKRPASTFAASSTSPVSRVMACVARRIDSQQWLARLVSVVAGSVRRSR